MDIEKIIQLIDKVSESPISSLEVEEGSLKISIEKNNGVMNTITEPMQVVPQVMPIQTQTVNVEAAPVEAPVVEDNSQSITAPIVGVFYSAPNPDTKPYVQVGDVVKKGQIVGIIEAMKLMNEIESEVEGTISEILVDNAQAVEFGQPLFKVK